MKKMITLLALVFVLIAGLTSCTKTVGPKAGSAKAEDMLKLLPEDANGVFFIDLKRAMNTEFARKAVTEEEDIQELIEKTNIDPLEDLFFLAGAVTQKASEDENEKVAFILNLDYIKDELLSFIKEKAQEEDKEISETDYAGHVVYSMWENDKELSFSFLDESNILLGDRSQAEAIIDVIENKKNNFTSNKALADLVDKTDKQAIFWGAIHFKPESMNDMTADNPMFEDLKNLQSASMTFDYKNNAVLANIQLMGGDETNNKNLADFLTGIKGFAGMMAAEKPEIGELMSAIVITSGADSVEISANLPDELLNKLKKEIKPDETEEEIK